MSKIRDAFVTEFFELVKKHDVEIPQVLALLTSVYMTAEEVSVMSSVITENEDGSETLRVHTEYGGFELNLNRTERSAHIAQA